MAHARKRGKYWHVKYKKPDGKYGSASRDDFGNRFTSEREAEKYGQMLEADVSRKVFIAPKDGKVPFSVYAEQWFDTIDVSPLSRRDYHSRLDAVLVPYWGSVNIGDINELAYTAWVKRLREEGRSVNSIRGLTSLFRTMMEDAMRSRLIAQNPAPPRKTRRGKYKQDVVETDYVIATPRQALLVAENALQLRGLSYYALVLATAYTQLRIGEVAGLRRWDLELEDRGQGARIHLHAQSQYVAGKPTLVAAKYGSARGLILPPFLADLLRQLIASHEGEFVFTAPKGGRLLIGGDFYRDTWHPIVEGRAALPSSRGHRARPPIRPVAGLRGLVPHGLRHSGKVWLDEGGHPRVAVEARMGHVLPGVEGTYSHVTLDMELRIAAYLQQLWEDSQRVVVDRREFGPVPPLEDRYRPRGRKSPLLMPSPRSSTKNRPVRVVEAS